MVERTVDGGEDLVGAPRDEDETRIGRAIEIEVVAISGLTIPMADEDFESPEGVEAVYIDDLGQCFETCRGWVL